MLTPEAMPRKQTETAGNSEPVSRNTQVSFPAQAGFLLWLLLPHGTDPKKGKGCPSQEECVIIGPGDSSDIASIQTGHGQPSLTFIKANMKLSE